MAGTTRWCSSMLGVATVVRNSFSKDSLLIVLGIIVVVAAFLWATTGAINGPTESVVERRAPYYRLLNIMVGLKLAEQRTGRPLLAVNQIGDKRVSWRVMILPDLDKAPVYRAFFNRERDREALRYINQFDFYSGLVGSQSTPGATTIVAIGENDTPLSIDAADAATVPKTTTRHIVIVDLGTPQWDWWSTKDMTRSAFVRYCQSHPSAKLMILWSDGAIEAMTGQDVVERQLGLKRD